eukprot:TRINITY_DN21767_c0_g1_i1.p1 TRINITY_DN21767_c0_g1~~TRINITY_DN21767_c0_g1_i1.p1  ORF type:complete len:234 (+),score=77.62 TRINITY_DN21767_c0_g1_i1:30-704(+)
MTTVADLVSILESTTSPKKLLMVCGKFVAPPYMANPVFKLSGTYHAPPYSTEETYAINQAKKAADVSGEQTRMDEVFKNLLIGNQFAAEDSPYLALNGVTHVVNTAGTVSQPDCVRPNQEHLKQLGIELLNLEINDKSDVPIGDFFDSTADWIHAALQSGGKVLVNCWQGASRSSTMVLAYLVKCENMELKEAVRVVKEKRDIRPNPGFLEQLLEYEQKCKNRK